MFHFMKLQNEFQKMFRNDNKQKSKQKNFDITLNNQLGDIYKKRFASLTLTTFTITKGFTDY